MTDGQELARALRAAYWAMNRRTNAILADHSVTADQFVLLSRLADEEGITQQVLAKRASSDANTTSAMLLLLQKRGFVTRRAHDSDGRAHCVILTAKGRRAIAAMMKATAQCRRQMLSAVKYGRARTLSKNLYSVARVLESAAKRTE
jgi:DNA-binding MarR family transcriptional regulator